MYKNFFAFEMKEFDALIGHRIRIKLASDTPIFCSPYRYSDMESDLIRSRILKLLKAVLVKLSHGEYASAIVIPVKKYVHDNYMNKQMYGDYGQINRQMKFR